VLPGFPTESWILDRVKPQYKKVRGWKKSVHKIRDYSLLPQAFRDYLKLIEDLIGARVSIISTGVERRDTILIDTRLKDIVNLEKIKKEIS
jgi:adenylosuccinate synthase